MSLTRTRAEAIDLAALLQGIHDGIVALPDFQRDFKWTDKDVIALLATVLSGWPLGSLLLVTGPPSVFQVRKFESAPSLADPHALEFTVLDGQQRLTALYHALYAEGDYRYGLHLESLGAASVDDLEDAIQAHRIVEWDRNYRTHAQQASKRVVPISALRSASDYFAWRDATALTLDASRRAGYLDELDRLYRSLLSGLDRYAVPAVIVGGNIPPAAVARIFERVNRTGWKLGTFDLMVAKSFTEDFNLRRAWEDGQAEYPRLAAFLRNDGYPVLQAIALRESKEVRQSGILDISGDVIRRRWDEACRAVDEAVAFLASECGVFHPDWLPYPNILVVLSALAQDRPLMERRAELVAWFWLVSAGGTYDVGSNTAAVKDYGALRANGRLEARYEVQFLLPDVLETSARRKQAFHRAFKCAMASNGARDLLDGTQIRADTLNDGVLPQIWTVAALPDGESGSLARYRASLPTLSCGLSVHPPAVYERSGTRDVPGGDDVARSQFLGGSIGLIGNDVESMRLWRLQGWAEFLADRGVRTRIVEPEPEGA